MVCAHPSEKVYKAGKSTDESSGWKVVLYWFQYRLLYFLPSHHLLSCCAPCPNPNPAYRWYVKSGFFCLFFFPFRVRGKWCLDNVLDPQCPGVRAGSPLPCHLPLVVHTSWYGCISLIREKGFFCFFFPFRVRGKWCLDNLVDPQHPGVWEQVSNFFNLSIYI